MVRCSHLVAVSTSVLAAMAGFGDASACPLGRELQVDRPSLPWQVRPSTGAMKLAPTPPKLAIRTAVGDGAVLARVIERELATARCGVGNGELIVRIARRLPVATVSGFDRITAACLERAIGAMFVRRVGDDTVVRVVIELR